MRTRTKIKIGVTIWTLTMASIVIIGNTLQERANAAPILGFLIGGDAMDWMVHVTGVVKENISQVKRKEG